MMLGTLDPIKYLHSFGFIPQEVTIKSCFVHRACLLCQASLANACTRVNKRDPSVGRKSAAQGLKKAKDDAAASADISQGTFLQLSNRVKRACQRAARQMSIQWSQMRNEFALLQSDCFELCLLACLVQLQSMLRSIIA